MEVEFGEPCEKSGQVGVGDVGDDEVLVDGGAELGGGEVFEHVGEGEEVHSGETAVEDAGADGVEVGLALGADAGVVAEDVVGDFVGDAGGEFVAEDGFDFGEEGLGGPSLGHKEVFEAGAVAGLAEALLAAEELGDGADGGDDFRFAEEGVELDGEVGFFGEAAADAD